MTKGFITKSMFDNLDYDNVQMTTNNANVTADVGHEEWTSPTAIIVFAGGDLNAAALRLSTSLQRPFACDAVASVFVQESIRNEFVDIVRPLLKRHSDGIAKSANYKKALEFVNRLNLQTVDRVSTSGNDDTSSTIVFDVTQEELGSKNGPTGFTTFHTFRTAKEAIALFAKETVPLVNVSIWHQNHSCAYELISSLRSKNFFVNCFQVSMESIKSQVEKGESYVLMDKSYHYETMPLNGLQKTIIFPVGTIFAN